MHGVKRSRLSAQAREERKVKEAAKLQSYLALENAFFDARDRNDRSEASLELTGKLLSVNPEHYTAWNFRRAIITALAAAAASKTQPSEASASRDFFAAARTDQPGTESAPSANQAKQWLLDADLDLTEHALRSHPKVYWIWNHRKWCLEQYPEDPAEEGSSAASDDSVTRKWTHEMRLVNKMLELDGRNFHGWDYRRYLLCQLAAAASESGSTEVPPPFPDTLSAQSMKDELAYTLTKIEKDFSNFSAWHQRQLLLQRTWTTDDGSKGKASDLLREFELIQQAMYTDPSDQSVWQYHRWLLEQDPSQEAIEREIAVVEELLEVEPDAKWCILALVHYKAMRRRLQAGPSNADSTQEEAELLERLCVLDPDRRRRYEDELRHRVQS